MGGSAVRYDRAGRLDLVVDLPVSNVTACAFGGPDLQTLFMQHPAKPERRISGRRRGLPL
jgi:sugar lactone lactonase YvrE